MLSEDLPLDEMDLVGFDLETTSRHAPVARPVTAALVRETSTGITAEDGFPLLIDPGVPIPPETVRVHGITQARAAQGLPLRRALEAICRALTEAVACGRVLAGANIRYDLTVLEWCCAREGVRPLGERVNGPLPVVDGMLIDHWWNRYRPGPGKGGPARNLSGLCAVYGVELEAAHDCAADAAAAVHLARAVLERARGPESGTGGPWERDRAEELRACATVADLLVLQWRWAAEQADSREAFERSRGLLGCVQDRAWPVVPFEAQTVRGSVYAQERDEAGVLEGVRDELLEVLARVFDAARCEGVERAQVMDRVDRVLAQGWRRRFDREVQLAFEAGREAAPPHTGAGPPGSQPPEDCPPGR